jgi:hypothetical protein
MWHDDQAAPGVRHRPNLDGRLRHLHVSKVHARAPMMVIAAPVRAADAGAFHIGIHQGHRRRKPRWNNSKPPE